MKILVRSPNWIGDMVMSTPVVRALRRKYPDAKITVLSRQKIAPLWTCNPDTDEILQIQGFFSTVKQLRKNSFDLAVVLPDSFKSALMVFMAGIPERMGYATECRGFMLTCRIPVSDGGFRRKHITDEYLDIIRPLGVEKPEKKPVLNVTDAGKNEAEKIIRENNLNSSMLIGISPGATYGPAKRWPEENFIRAAREISDKYRARILVFGSREEAWLAGEISSGIGKTAVNLAGKLSLPGLAAMISLCRALIANDTGTVHLAAALNVPSVAIFGSSSPVWTSPLGETTSVLYQHESCSPCFERTCRKNDYSCLKSITAEHVMSAFEGIMKKNAS